ncbi:TPA: hypothetical protein ACH3X1_012088 [Trebouxia sp. C0004]
MQAGFGAVATTANTVCFLFNFLTDGVSAKLGKHAGAADWVSLRKHVKLALICGLAGAALACSTLAVLKPPITLLLNLQPEVLRGATPYWWVRVAITPLVLLNMSISGILQGFNRVTAATMLISGQALLEIAGTLAVFLGGLGSHENYLRNMGLVTLASAFISACVGLLLVKLLRPPMTSALDDRQELLIAEDLACTFLPADVLLHTDEEALVVGPVVAKADSVTSNDNSLMGFLADGASMLVRSTLLQATFFIALAVASRMGTAALAAHQIVAQLWLLTSYVTDGFAVAGTVLGSRLSHQRLDSTNSSDTRSLQVLCNRVLLSGLAIGTLCGFGFFVAEDWLISLFTKADVTVDILHNNLWSLLCVVQPLNSLVFVYDGLLYASQSFAFTRNVMLVGFCLVFCPMITVAQYTVKALWGVWVAKAALNLCRLLGGMYRIHIWWFQTAEPLTNGTV